METGNSWIVLNQQSQPCDSAGPNICELVYPGENLACSFPCLAWIWNPGTTPMPTPSTSTPSAQGLSGRNVFDGQAGKDRVPFHPQTTLWPPRAYLDLPLAVLSLKRSSSGPPMDLQPCFSQKNYSIQPVLEIATRLQTNKWQISAWEKTRMTKPTVFPLKCNMEF